MKFKFLLFVLLLGLQGFVCGMDDYGIMDNAYGYPSSSFYYRKSNNVSSPKTTTIDFDPKVIFGKEVDPKNIKKDSLVVQGIETKLPKKRVSFAPGTKAQKEDSMIDRIVYVLNWISKS